jgi:hypothetical protein
MSIVTRGPPLLAGVGVDLDQHPPGSKEPMKSRAPGLGQPSSRHLGRYGVVTGWQAHVAPVADLSGLNSQEHDVPDEVVAS